MSHIAIRKCGIPSLCHACIDMSAEMKSTQEESMYLPTHCGTGTVTTECTALIPGTVANCETFCGLMTRNAPTKMSLILFLS